MAALIVGGLFVLVHGLWGKTPQTQDRRAEVRLQPLTTQRLWLVGTTAALMVFVLGCLAISFWYGRGASGSGTLEKASLIAICLVGPFIEEVAFRGWMLRRIESLLGRQKAALVTAFFFALYHFELVGFPIRFALAVVAAIVVYATGSLWSAIFLHVSNNSLLLGLAHVFPNLDDLLSRGHRPAAVLAVGIGAVCLGLLGVFLATRWFWRGQSGELRA